MTPSIYLILRIIYLLCFLSHARTTHQTPSHSGHFDPNLLGRSDPSHSDNSDHFYPLLGSVSCAHCLGFQEEQLFRSRCVGSSWNPGFPSGTPAHHEMELKVDFSNIRSGIGSPSPFSTCCFIIWFLRSPTMFFFTCNKFYYSSNLLPQFIRKWLLDLN